MTADQVAIALENARLIRENKRRADELGEVALPMPGLAIHLAFTPQLLIVAPSAESLPSMSS